MRWMTGSLVGAPTVGMVCAAAGAEIRIAASREKRRAGRFCIGESCCRAGGEWKGETASNHRLLAERIAHPRITAVEALPEPARALRRRAMRKRVRVHMAGGLLLDAIVTHGGRGIQCLVHIPCLEQLTLLRGMRPD